MDFPPRPLRWLFLDLNSYFASVEQQLNPRLRGRPVIVAPVDSETTCAIAASYEAKRYGIKTGTPIWEARRKCPDLSVVTAQHDCYIAFHEKIVAEINRHIPVTQICSIDEVACRLMDNENDEDFARALAVRIKRGITQNVGACLTSSVGIAPNRLLAKLASDMMKPDGLIVLRGETLPEQLYTLKLGDICGIGRRMERRLAMKGVNSIRQFCALGPRAAGKVWGGTPGDRLWYLLHGVDLPEKPTQSRSIGHSHVMAPDLRGPNGSLFTARRLALKATSRLRGKAYQTRLLVLHARFEVSKAHWNMAAKMRSTQDSFAVLAALDTLWPHLLAAGSAHPGGFRLFMIGVTLNHIEPVAAQQGTLFPFLDPSAGLACETRTLALSQAMDRLNTRFGNHMVSLGPDLRPLNQRSHKAHWFQKANAQASG